VNEDGDFDECIAARYDQDATSMFDQAEIDATVGFLADLAGVERALELGIRTGRIALRSQCRESRFTASTFQKAMVSKLREKPGAERPHG
jgi:hypothetical protein